jgi:hypothetical protein
MENLIRFKNNFRRYWRKIDKMKIFLVSIFALIYLLIIIFDVVPVEKRSSLKIGLVLLFCCIYFVYSIKINKG